MLHAPIVTSFVTSDPDVGSARVAEVYADNRLRVTEDSESFHLEQRRADLGAVRLDTFSNSLTTEYTMQPLGQVIIARMLHSELDVWTEQTHRRLGPGDVALLAQADREYATTVHGARMQLVGIDLDLLDEVDGGPEDAGRRLRYEPLDPARAAAWQRTVRYVADTLLDDADTSPLVLGSTARLLAASLLSAFAPDDATEPVVRADALPGLVRRAVAYCDASPDLDIGVADIARACHVSVRTLQVAFRRHLGTTPMTYLRRVRLDRARADLVATDPDEATVTRIAARWGFADAGRFSAHYRDAYGELPRDTLRRR